MKNHDLIARLRGRHPNAEVLLMTQRKQPFENYVAGVVGRDEMLDQQHRHDAGVEPDDVFIVVGTRIRPGSLSAWIVAESPLARTAELCEPTSDVPAVLEQIAAIQLGVETLTTRGSDELDFHRVGVAGLRTALHAAYCAGRDDPRIASAAGAVTGSAIIDDNATDADYLSVT